MAFKIKANNATFEWRDGRLLCDDQKALTDFKREIKLHLPKVVAMPDLIDYDDDLSDQENVYEALKSIYPDCKVIEEPNKEQFYQFNPNVIY